MGFKNPFGTRFGKDPLCTIHFEDFPERNLKKW
jgi:hypothetical protein